ncbi:MAG: hypothetical protein SF070_07270 [Gemmatimonadota bacterium]|nr:hypothetical protein [Gemmatimonadota bacterium]
MHARYLLLAAASLVLLPAAASAQRVVADISIHDGPVSGRVILGDPYGYRTRYHAPQVRTVVVYRSARGHGWYHRHGYRTVRVWYDADRHRYYDRYDRNYRGLREVVVYERGGRYYQDDSRYDDRRNDYRRRVDDRRYDDHRYDDDRYDDDRHRDRDRD